MSLLSACVEPELVDRFGHRNSVLFSHTNVITFSRSVFESQNQSEPTHTREEVCKGASAVSTQHHRKTIQVGIGDVLFLPSLLAFETENISENVCSLFLMVHLPSQMDWTQVLNQILAVSQEQMSLNPNTLFFPHARTFAEPDQLGPTNSIRDWTEGSVLESKLSEMMAFATGTVTQTVKMQLQMRCSFGRSHFNVPQEWIFARHLKGKTFEKLVEESNGIVKLANFLPEVVAERILTTLQGIQEDGEWLATEAEPDSSQNNIAHSFLSAKTFPNSHAIFNIFEKLMPRLESSFSAGRYSAGHFIDPHDDRAYKEFYGDLYSRSYAVIYYLTKDWTVEDGGALLDLETEKPYIPEFNSLIVFKVPRWHEVEPVLSNRSRYSVFGWFFEPGTLYELQTSGSPQESEDDEDE